MAEFRFRAADSKSVQNSTASPFLALAPAMSVNPLSSEALQREIEKQRIRREILEDEVRRERAMGLLMHRNVAEPFSFQDWPMTMRPNLSPFEEQEASSDSADKDKENADVCGEKRKAETHPFSAGTQSAFTSNKKLKGVFGCELCQVTSTSEQALHDHLQGKKHKAKEAAQQSRRIGLVDPVEMPVLQPSWMVEEVEQPLLQPGDMSKGDMHVTVTDNGVQELETGAQYVQENQLWEDASRAPIGSSAEEPRASTQNEYPYWCHICQVGTQTTAVMETHINGKKHKKNAKKHTNRDLVSSSFASLETPPLIEDTGAANTELKKVPMLKPGLVFPDI